MYPKDDLEFEVCMLKSVTKERNGDYMISRDDGWSYSVPWDTPIIPEAGMSARIYGKGLGINVRGLFIDDVRIFYRTADEDKSFREILSRGPNWI